MNTNEKIIIHPQYDDISWSFGEGLIAVAKDDKWGFINKDNEIAIPFYYDKAYRFENDKAEVELNGETFYIDKQGNRLP